MNVKMSARIWHGWYSFVSPLMTGTRELAANTSMRACSNVRIITRSTMRLMTRAVSSMGSARPSCESPVVRLMTEPPIWYMPASNETRVRVEAFSNTIASVRSDQRLIGDVTLEAILDDADALEQMRIVVLVEVVELQKMPNRHDANAGVLPCRRAHGPYRRER